MVPLEQPDAAQTSALIRAGELSPRAALERALARIAECDEQINAFSELLTQPARAQAAAVEAAQRRGEELGPLAGVPVAVKDAIWVEGARSTNGSRALRDFVARVDAVAVRRLRDAGAVIVGKTTNPELCLRGVTESALLGTTRNPVDPTRTCGGSSGGSAAAVAYGAVDAALGTDGGGSIRIPGSFCGVAGHKPSHSLVPRGPGFRGWETLSVIGPLARTARDLRLLLGVIAGYDASDELALGSAEQPIVLDDDRAPSQLRIAHSVDLGFAPVAPGVRSAFETAIGRLRDAGWTLDAAAPESRDGSALWNELAVVEGHAAFRDLLAGDRAELLEPDTRRLLEAGAGRSAADYLDVLASRADYVRRWQAFFDDHDVLLTPTMQITAFEIGILGPQTIDGKALEQFYDDWCSFSLPANLTGMPATTLPCGVDERGLPVGLQIMAPRGRDATTLALAAACERLLA